MKKMHAWYDYKLQNFHYVFILILTVSHYFPLILSASYIFSEQRV